MRAVLAPPDRLLVLAVVGAEAGEQIAADAEFGGADKDAAVRYCELGIIPGQTTIINESAATANGIHGLQYGQTETTLRALPGHAAVAVQVTPDQMHEQQPESSPLW